MRADAAEERSDYASHTRVKANIRGKKRPLTLDHLDFRTRASKRARALAKAFEAELGGAITLSMRMAVERAAALLSLAQDAQARRIAGDQTIGLDDVVRLDNAAQRAVKALGIKRHAEKRETLLEKLRKRDGEVRP